MDKKKRDAVIVILISNAILISLLELLIPLPVPVPGVKLGLANIITIIAIVFLDLKDVLLIVSTRCIVAAVLSKGITALPFSLSGGILSALVMWLCYHKLSRWLSLKGISVAGAIVHNGAQLSVASLILGESVLLFYLPVLMISAVVTGLITGFVAGLTVEKIKEWDVFNEPQPRPRT